MTNNKDNKNKVKGKSELKLPDLPKRSLGW